LCLETVCVLHRVMQATARALLSGHVRMNIDNQVNLGGDCLASRFSDLEWVLIAKQQHISPFPGNHPSNPTPSLHALPVCCLLCQLPRLLLCHGLAVAVGQGAQGGPGVPDLLRVCGGGGGRRGDRFKRVWGSGVAVLHPICCFSGPFPATACSAWALEQVTALWSLLLTRTPWLAFLLAQSSHCNTCTTACPTSVNFSPGGRSAAPW
jgi:hypothetical protein